MFNKINLDNNFYYTTSLTVFSLKFFNKLDYKSVILFNNIYLFLKEIFYFKNMKIILCFTFKLQIKYTAYIYLNFFN